jgi:hypothetical protein
MLKLFSDYILSSAERINVKFICIMASYKFNSIYIFLIGFIQ